MLIKYIDHMVMVSCYNLNDFWLNNSYYHPCSSLVQQMIRIIVIISLAFQPRRLHLVAPLLAKIPQLTVHLQKIPGIVRCIHFADLIIELIIFSILA